VTVASVSEQQRSCHLATARSPHKAVSCGYVKHHEKYNVLVDVTGQQRAVMKLLSKLVRVILQYSTAAKATFQLPAYTCGTKFLCV
jgi:hypothetical protein